MATNLGWEFYKGYFKNIDYNNLSNPNNETITNEKIERLLHQNQIFLTNEKDEMIGNIHFKATTTYPGLLLGSGYLHELPDVKGQLILGFDFDYTTGLPIIRGSSIKGVLRSAFQEKEYIKEILKDENIDISELEKEICDNSELEKEIFDNNDIFFDAQIIKIQNTLLADDYLAPHKEITKDPIPLRFLKLAPNVTFRFDFELSDGIISKEQKRELFKTILEDLGVGAKTNVGYGKLEDFENIQTPEEKMEEELQRKESKFQEVMKSERIEDLERFKIDYQYKTEEIDKKIEELKTNLAISEIQRAFDNLDKSNKKHIESFIKKYENNEKAQQFINQLKNNNSKQNNTSIDDIIKITKFKPLQNKLKNISLSNEDKEILKNHILNNMEKLKKRKQFPFGVLKPIFGEDETNNIADELGLK